MFFKFFSKSNILDQNILDTVDLEDFISGMVDGIIIGDLTGKIKTVNKAEENITGFTKEEMIGQNTISLLVDKKDRMKALRILKDIVTKGFVRDEEVLSLKKDGSNYISYISATLVKDRHGIPNSIIVVKRDITERIKNEQKIAELNEALKVLNKILRHDILNDITVIANGVEEYNSQKDEELLSDALLAAKRSKETIEKMKQVEESITTGGPLKVIQLTEVLRPITDTFTELKITITGDAKVTADEALSSVFANLFRNAIRHGNASEVQVNIFQDEENVTVKVCDNGKGIPDEIKDKLFIEGAKFGETGNTGLGLYIIRKSIERYGGKVSVEKNTPQGACFIIKLKNV